MGPGITKCSFASHKTNGGHFLLPLHASFLAFKDLPVQKNTALEEIWTFGSSGNVFVYLNSQD